MPNVRSVQFGLCSIRIFFPFLLCFLFLSVFFLTDTNDSQYYGKGRGSPYFSCFPLPPAYEHSFSSWRFLPLLFNRSVCNYRLIGDETCSPQRFAFFWIFIDEIRSELLTLTSQSDITRICAHSKLSTFYRTNTLTAILILQFILLIAIIYSRGQNKKKIVETVLWLNLQCIY